MPNARRILVVMRHAKAEPTAASDRQRTLTPDGAADARAAGEWLARTGAAPDRALVSDSTRTRATWAALAEGAGLECETDFDESLYDAGPETVLDLVRMVDDEVGTLLVIGHSPTIPLLAQMLADAEGDAFTEMALGFPTCSLAALQFEGSWADLVSGGARVVAFHVARA